MPAQRVMKCWRSDLQNSTKKQINLVGMYGLDVDYSMIVWILAKNDINFAVAAGLIRLHIPGVKYPPV